MRAREGWGVLPFETCNLYLSSSSLPGGARGLLGEAREGQGRCGVLPFETCNMHSFSSCLAPSGPPWLLLAPPGSWQYPVPRERTQEEPGGSLEKPGGGHVPSETSCLLRPCREFVAFAFGPTQASGIRFFACLETALVGIPRGHSVNAKGFTFRAALDPR